MSLQCKLESISNIPSITQGLLNRDVSQECIVGIACSLIDARFKVIHYQNPTCRHYTAGQPLTMSSSLSASSRQSASQ